MSRKLVWAIVALIVAAAVVLVFMALENRGGDKSSSGSTTAMDMSGTSDSQTANRKPTATDKVTINNFSFSPAAITVKVGTTVTWTNRDAVGHTVTSDTTGSGPVSQTLGQGQSYSYTFTKAGTFTYHCAIHPDMKGSVVVTH